MKFFLVFLIPFGISIFVTGQTPTLEWQRSLGGTNIDKAAAVIVTQNGNYLVAGRIESYDGDVTGFYSASDIWLVELDSTGTNIIWQNNLGGTASESCESIQQTNDGGFILCGRTSSNDGDVSGLHCWNPPCPFGGIPDIWVAKTDNLGNLQKQRCLGGTDDENAYDIQQTFDGGYVVVGSTNSNDSDVIGNHLPLGTEDIWVVKLDTSLNIQWQKCLGGSGLEEGFSIKQTPDSGFIISGFTFVSNDGDVSGSNGGADAWIVKLNMYGAIQWSKCYGGSQHESASYIQLTSDNGYIFVGSTNSNDSDVSGNHGSYDYWVVKLDSIGSIQWQHCYGGSADDISHFIELASNNSYLVCGGSLSLNGDITSNNGDEDFWVLKINDSGNIIWQTTLGGTHWEQALEVREISEEKIVVAGYSTSLDGDVTGHHGGLTCNGASYPCDDFWVVKLSNIGIKVDEIFSELFKLSIFLNAVNSVELTFNSKVETTISVELVDITGKIITEHDFSITEGINKLTIFQNKISYGVFFIRVLHSSGTFVKKFVSIQ